MNATVSPCNDFYAFACGNFKNTHPIPLDQKKIFQRDDRFNEIEREGLGTLNVNIRHNLYIFRCN